ncbi:MAG: hypothetical protein IJG33_17885 [Selenomonadaceae bacterium]|nr:hypothetical protein [Selenomonadaceae bacterium]
MNFALFSEKVEALRTRILKECKEQGFSINDFEELVIRLNMDLEKRQHKAHQEVLF